MNEQVRATAAGIIRGVVSDREVDDATVDAVVHALVTVGMLRPALTGSPWYVRLRAGRKVGRTLYVQMDALRPSELDRLVGLVDTPALAQMIVELAEERHAIELAAAEAAEDAGR